MIVDKIVGLVAAPFVPLTSDGGLNLGLIPDYAEHLRRDGVAGVFVNGTTGEGPSLTSDERKEIAEIWRRQAGEMKVIVHVGHTAIPEAGDFAAHAEAIGADGIGFMAPCFFKPELPELVACCAAVARRAPRTPFYYYHIPALSGVNPPMLAFLRAAAPSIPTLAGVKFTYENLMDYQQCVEEQAGRFDILCGRDEILLSALAAGAVGAVGSTYNYVAPVYGKLLAAYRTGDFAQARQLQARAQALVQILIDSGNGVACGKALMPLLTGLDCGPCRLPLPVFSQDKHAWLRARIDALGLPDTT